MDGTEYLAGVASILLLMAFVALAELVVPLAASDLQPARRRARLRANLSITAVTFLANFGVLGAAALLPQTASPLSLASLPSPLFQWAAAIVLMDFAFGYLAHRAMHELPLLWRFHRVHHADAFVDVTTTYRTHPVEQAWRFGLLTATVVLFAIPPGVFAVYRIASAVNALFEHANIRVHRAVDRALSSVWVTPNMHKVHHSDDPRETDTNYGNLLSLHDRLLGTFTPTARAFDVRYGLGDDETDAATRILAAPFAGPATRAEASVPS